MKIRIHFYKDMEKHTYFFEDPDYENALTQKFERKLKQSNDINIRVLSDIKDMFEKIDEAKFEVDKLNKDCSLYLYENHK